MIKVVSRTVLLCGLLATFANCPVSAQGGSWEVFDMSSAGFPSNTVRCLLQDEAGILWAGTDYGLCRYDGSEWTVLQTTNSGIPSNDITCLAVDSLDRLWVGTLFNGLGILEGEEWTYLNSSNGPFALDEINGITHDHRGWVWISTPLGLACDTGDGWRLYDDTPESHMGFQFFLPNTRAVAVREDGLISVATVNAGLVYITEEEFIYYTTFNSFFPDNTTNAIALDSNGDRWLACPSGGLVWHSQDFQGGPWFAYNGFTLGLPDNSMTSVFVDADDQKIVGTQIAGVLLFNDASDWYTLDQQNSGLPDNGVLSVYRDRDGVLWAGTASAGLARYTPTVGISDPLEATQAFTAFPNPFQDRLTIRSRLGKGLDSWVVRDISGRVLMTGSKVGPDGISLDLGRLPNGSYTVSVISGGILGILPVIRAN